jgi:hypothetical protein
MALHAPRVEEGENLLFKTRVLFGGFLSVDACGLI